jgi:hypothetical protein
MLVCVVTVLQELAPGLALQQLCRSGSVARLLHSQAVALQPPALAFRCTCSAAACNLFNFKVPLLLMCV